MLRRKKTATKKSTRRAGTRKRRPVKRSARTKRTVRKRGSRITAIKGRPLFNADQARVKMLYAEPMFTTGSLPLGVYRDRYALNGAYDPYMGAGGGQPSGFATLAAQYGSYYVHGSKITVTVTRDDGNTNRPYDMAICPISYLGATTPPTSMSQYREQPYCKYRAGTTVTTDGIHTMTHYMSVNKIEGMQDTWAASYRGGVASNPTALSEWHILFSDPLAATNVVLDYSVKIVYYVTWINRLSNPASFMDEIIKEAKKTGLMDEVKRRLMPIEVVTEGSRVRTLPVRPESKEPMTDPEIDSYPDDPDEEFDDLPGEARETSSSPPVDIPKACPPKASSCLSEVPVRAPTSVPPPGGPVLRTRISDASVLRRPSTKTVSYMSLR